MGEACSCEPIYSSGTHICFAMTATLEDVANKSFDYIIVGKVPALSMIIQVTLISMVN